MGGVLLSFNALAIIIFGIARTLGFNFSFALFISEGIFGVLAAATLLSYFLPFALFGVITLGGWTWHYEPYYPIFHPSSGWVQSYGIQKNKKWEGQLYGQFFMVPFIESAAYAGIIGFTGIKIIARDSCHYIGSALWIKIGPEHPEE